MPDVIISGGLFFGRRAADSHVEQGDKFLSPKNLTPF